MKQDWYAYGEWKDIPILAVDSWNGKFNNQILIQLLGDFLRILQFWKDNKKEVMFVSKSSEDRITKLIRSRFLADPKAFHKVVEEYRKNRPTKKMDEIEKIDLSLFTNSQLVDLFLETRKLIGYSGALDWYDFSIENRIWEAVDLDEYIEENKEEKEIILSLIDPEAILPTLAEEIEILKIAVKARGMDKNEIKEKFKEEIASIIKEYSWLPSLIFYPFKTEEEYLNQIIEEARKDSVEEELSEKLNFVKNSNTRLKKYIEEKNPPQKVIDSIYAIKKLSEMRAVGDMDTLYCFSRCRKLDKEIRKKLGLSREDYHNLYMDEVVGLLRSEIEIPNLETRKKIEGFYRDEKGAFRPVDNPQEVFDRLRSVKIKSSELKGMSGYPGRVQGAVKLVHSSQDIHNFREGEILVAKSTCSDYVVIMKKASAIVTEFGGITSHAAVISRELKRPCVVGVKNATTFLKDGDLVEVDANKGLIKKL